MIRIFRYFTSGSGVKNGDHLYRFLAAFRFGFVFFFALLLEVLSEPPWHLHEILQALTANKAFEEELAAEIVKARKTTEKPSAVWDRRWIPGDPYGIHVSIKVISLGLLGFIVSGDSFCWQYHGKSW